MTAHCLKHLARVAALAGVAAICAVESSIVSAQDSEAEFVLPPIEEFSPIIERPLFTPGRRPPEGDVEESVQAPVDDTATESPQQFVLAGTATDQSERAVAILHDSASGVDFRVWVGDEIGGWIVKAIEPRAIVLVDETREVTVTLDEPDVPLIPGVE